MDMDTLTDTSATPYLVSLFTFIDLQTFYPFTITTVPVPCYYTIERGPVYLGELRERVLSITLYRLCLTEFFFKLWHFHHKYCTLNHKNILKPKVP
jgi:hypothetical protein